MPMPVGRTAVIPTPVISMFLVALLASGAAAPAMTQQEIKPLGRRIVGGKPTTVEMHPWQVALDITLDGESYLCGGSIVADRWVLTAAHCLAPSTKPSAVKVKSGATYFRTQGEWTDIDLIVIHDAYDSTSHENDLALVKLRTRPQGQVIPLATAKLTIPVGQPLEVTGWGAASEDGEPGNDLLEASVPYVDNATCNAPAAYDGAVKPGMICAGYRDGGLDSCQGDSGGPLVWRTSDGPVLVGVVSWGEGCARKLRYGVYTRTESYADWVGKVVAGGALGETDGSMRRTGTKGASR
jgi:secreted trypsin-like serine protease